MEAQAIVSKVEAEFEGYSETEYVDELQNHWICEDIQSVCTTDQMIRTYFAATGTMQMKKRRVEHKIRECIHNLKVRIFGNAQLGLSSFV